ALYAASGTDPATLPPIAEPPGDRLRDAAQALAEQALRRARALPRWARLALPGGLAAPALIALVASRLSADARPEREVEARVAAGDVARAARLVAAGRRSSPGSATVEKLLGDLSCAGGEQETCLLHYRRALERSSHHASDARLRKNVLLALGR